MTTVRIETKSQLGKPRIRAIYDSTRDRLTLKVAGCGEQSARRLRLNLGDQVQIVLNNCGLLGVSFLAEPNGTLLDVVRKWGSSPDELPSIRFLCGETKVSVYVRINEDLPAFPIETRFGVGAYLAPYQRLDGKRGIRWWAERHAERGLTAMRVVLLSGTWFYWESPWGSTTSVFSHVVQPTWLETLRCDLAYAQRLGVQVHLDLFDAVGMKHFDGRWSRHPFNAERNGGGEIVEGLPFEHGPIDNKYDAMNKFERLWRGEAFHPLRDMMQDYVYDVCLALANTSHVLCTGNELESRAVERAILSGTAWPRVCINGTYLWAGSAAAIDEAMYLTVNDSRLMQYNPAIRLHGITTDNVDWFVHQFGRQFVPGAPLILDNDGVGSGDEREPKGNRPSLENLLQLAQSVRELAGTARPTIQALFFKILSPEDGLTVMNALARRNL